MIASKLRVKFGEQAAFAAGYSPLYARLFSALEEWLADESDPLVAWLLHAGEGRYSLDASLLLPAAIHREILLGEPAVAPLARYFPTVGGELPPDHPGFTAALRQAILARP